MKKLSVLLCSALFLVACGNNDKAQTQSTSDTTQASEVVPVERYVVATEANYPPFDYRDDNGVIVGFDVDVLRAIAKNQGFGVDFIHSEFDLLFETLETGKAQILGACLASSAERMERSELSNAYVFSPNVIMSEESKAVDTLAGLAGKTVAVQKGSASQKELSVAPPKEIIEETTLFGAYRSFALGKADYVVGDAGVLSYYHQSTPIPNKQITFTTHDKSADARAFFAVTKGNTELRDKINTGLANIQADGTYDAIYAKWFGDNPSLRIPTEFGEKPTSK